MGTNTSLLLPPDEVRSICEETGSSFKKIFHMKIFTFILGFTPKQLKRLYIRFQELEKRNPPSGYLTRQDLLDIREVALNPLGERLVDVMIKDHG